MDHQERERTISLTELWDVFLRRLWIILLAAVVAAGGTALYVNLTFVPQYASTATLYILRQHESAGNNATATDFSLALNVVNDCTYLLKSHSVLDQVIGELELECSYHNLYHSISARNPEDTRILEVTVVSDTPEQAKAIVDRLCEIGAEKVMDAMGFRQLNLYEYGTLGQEPCNRTSAVTYSSVAVLTAMITYAACLLWYVLDDAIRTEEDVERYMGLSVLGDIPHADEEKRRRHENRRAGKHRTGQRRED